MCGCVGGCAFLHIHVGQREGAEGEQAHAQASNRERETKNFPLSISASACTAATASTAAMARWLLAMSSFLACAHSNTSAAHADAWGAYIEPNCCGRVSCRVKIPLEVVSLVCKRDIFPPEPLDLGVTCSKKRVQLAFRGTRTSELLVAVREFCVNIIVKKRPELTDYKGASKNE